MYSLVVIGLIIMEGIIYIITGYEGIALLYSHYTEDHLVVVWWE